MTAEFHLNPRAEQTVAEAAPDRTPMQAHRAMPGYRVTPLRDCPAIARALGVASVVVKDEAERMGLPSFKILGASWATLQAVREAWLDGAAARDLVEVRDRLDARPADRTLLAATDGNHGRGVARMARLLGTGCRILVPEGTARARIDAIASEGADVEVVAGTYDDAVTRAAALAGPDALVVSDTSWDGYEAIPAEVIRGYSTLFFEIDDAIAAGGLPSPTVVALQAGVGAFASAGLRHFRSRERQPPVRSVIVEPITANCLMASAREGELTAVPGPHRSVMAGLNCGLPSRIAWPTIIRATDVFVAVSDEYAFAAMRALADAGIVAGESGAAGLAGLFALRDEAPPALRDAAGLHEEASVLLVNTEGATDPERYERIVSVGAHGETATARGRAVVHHTQEGIHP